MVQYLAGIELIMNKKMKGVNVYYENRRNDNNSNRRIYP